MEKGDLVRHKYFLEEKYGIIISEIQWHSVNWLGTAGQYVWILWDDGSTDLYKIEVLEVVNESG